MGNSIDFLRQLADELDSTFVNLSEKLRASLAALVLKGLKRKSWTQRDLARAIDVKESQVSRIIHSGSNCTIDTIAKLLHALEIDADLVDSKNLVRTTFTTPEIVDIGKRFEVDVEKEDDENEETQWWGQRGKGRGAVGEFADEKYLRLSAHAMDRPYRFDDSPQRQFMHYAVLFSHHAGPAGPSSRILPGENNSFPLENDSTDDPRRDRLHAESGRPGIVQMPVAHDVANYLLWLNSNNARFGTIIEVSNPETDE